MHQLTRVLAEYVHLRAEAQMLITSAGVRGVGLFFASISRSLLPYEQALLTLTHTSDLRDATQREIVV